MRLPLLVLSAASVLYGQMCAPSPILPSGQITGVLDGTACSLSDSTPYVAYRLVYPVRGSAQASLTSPAATPLKVNLSAILRNAAGMQIASGSSISTPVEA